ncbi:MAG: alpha-galactosidase, partial [Lentisphaeria bacterium]|nr:alpha-galactosidase [Lentisphaeria bacterium]
AACGFTMLVVDDGWFTEPDWQVIKEKFPRGLKVVSDYVHKLGLKFGLWFNIGTDYGMTTNTEANAARLDDGEVKRLGFDHSKGLTVQCFASAHRERMTEKLHQLASDYNVDYFKMDFSSINSPYGILPWGCHAHDHKYHRGFSDSFIAMYEGFDVMRAELKKLHPDLLLDFSFETFGMNDPSIGALACSELNHLSNLNSTKLDIESIEKVRRDFYNQSFALPPERLMHGLLALDNVNGIEFFLTSLCGMPLISGDLRNLDDNIASEVSTLVSAYRKIAQKGALTGLEVLNLPEKVDGFRRFADDGREFYCIFNGSDAAVSLDFLAGFKNVLSGDDSGVIAAGSCGMYIK